MIFDNKKYSYQKEISDKKFTLFFLFIFSMLSIFSFIKNFNYIFLFSNLSIFILIFGYFFYKTLIIFLKKKWLLLGNFLSFVVGSLIIGVIFMVVIFPTGIYYKIFKKRKNKFYNFIHKDYNLDFEKEY